jgi:glucan 1,3-beta-glucosidase
VPLPASPLAPGEKLYCISYAPFRGAQNPFDPEIMIDSRQIEEDLAKLKTISDCVRTYSVDHGLDRIAEIAGRHGMKVLQGLWLSGIPALSRTQVETTIALARRFPDAIAAVVVGNEVLLRGEMSALDLARTIREVKSQVSMPVTYADVWEFWQRHPELAPEVDFITIHILPYWEDFPVPAQRAADHVDAVRKQVGGVFPGKDILIGEFGWPSAGRMRDGALPSPSNQARTMQDVLALAKRENYRLNLIEAFDQPWKRELEGTVGGHWGLYDGVRRTPKFTWGGAVSDHPHWLLQAAFGVVLAALVFACAYFARTGGTSATSGLWVRTAVIAFISGSLIGWTIEQFPLESLGLGGWLRSLAWAAVAVLCPLAAAAAAASRCPLPTFAQVLARHEKASARLERPLGILLILVVLLAIEAGLGLVFDPRYRDFPFAPLSAAAFALLFVGFLPIGGHSKTPIAERVLACTLLICAAYVALNEGLANWQADWFALGLAALAATLLRGRIARG